MSREWRHSWLQFWEKNSHVLVWCSIFHFMVCQFFFFFFCLFVYLFSGPQADLSSSAKPCCCDGRSVCFRVVLPKCYSKIWLYLSALVVPFSVRELPTPQALCNPRTRRHEGFGTRFPKRISSFDQTDDSQKVFHLLLCMITVMKMTMKCSSIYISVTFFRNFRCLLPSFTSVRLPLSENAPLSCWDIAHRNWSTSLLPCDNPNLLQLNINTN